jgi:RNA polymerase sigma-70 factor (ECF subfamily)
MGMMEIESHDEFLFGELKAGNSRAFEKIFRQWYPLMCRYSCSIVHDSDKAQSLVQNVFIKLWETRLKLGHISNLPAFLTHMVKNESLNYLRSEKRSIHLPSFTPEMKIDGSGDHRILASDFTENLVAALALLPERCREAFELSRFEELSNREIAEKMDISVKGVEALVTRALKSLRHSLSGYLPSGKEKSIPGKILFLLFQKCRNRASF